MGSFACPARLAEWFAVGCCVLAVIAGCATTRAAYEAGVELPAGEGREILVTQCLSCHELGALELFSDFYTRDSWRSLVVSMRANGAEVDDAELEVLSDYLARNFGVQRQPE